MFVLLPPYSSICPPVRQLALVSTSPIFSNNRMNMDNCSKSRLSLSRGNRKNRGCGIVR